MNIHSQVAYNSVKIDTYYLTCLKGEWVHRKEFVCDRKTAPYTCLEYIPEDEPRNRRCSCWIRQDLDFFGDTHNDNPKCRYGTSWLCLSSLNVTAAVAPHVM